MHIWYLEPLKTIHKEQILKQQEKVDQVSVLSV